MTPKTRYQRDLQRVGFHYDSAQDLASDLLDALYHQVIKHDRVSPLRGLWNRLSGRSMEPVTGLYLWGGVGRGKTLLMDNFYECLPITQKQRIHFYRFMRDIHAWLRKFHGEVDPLERIGCDLAKRTRVLCFDEFFVSDITDAMILAGVLRSVFDNGVILLATSNTHPDELYKNGLQRDQFEPAIEMIKRNMTIIRLDGDKDYRLQLLARAEIYHHPLDEAADAKLAEHLERLTNKKYRHEATIEVLGRHIPVRACGEGVCWFEFQEICTAPRSHTDYVELSRYLHTALISAVPILDDQRNDETRRFIQLVDEFYDRSVNLILSAAAPPHNLYRGTRLYDDFQRTASRLTEMQSTEYLSREHRP